jgi:Putative zinc-finger
MNCEKYLILIDDLIEGELDSENAAQVNSHLSACRECDSYYAMLREEKEIYGQFLFDVEPPKDLWNQFQTKIETVPVVPTAETSNVSSGWNFNIFNYFRLYPALGFAAIIVFCAYGFWKFVPNKIVSNDEYAVKTNPVAKQTQNQSFENVTENEPKIKPNNDGKGNPDNLPQPIKTAYKLKSENQKTQDKKVISTTVDPVQPKMKKVFANPNQELQAQLTDEQMQLKALDTETAQQIEKIELLLRSFRNARVVEGSTLYDVAYEKEQARKLLGKNVQLRQIAENYGALYTEELLDKAEPFLLDIANLDNNPQPEQVLDIKERVKNQNIIASLQVY